MNVKHFLFSLLRIKDIYIFQALLDHPHEALQSGTWYNACMLCQLAAPGPMVPPTDITRTQYTKCRFLASPVDEQVLLET
jgi:hypothetical protein